MELLSPPLDPAMFQLDRAKVEANMGRVHDAMSPFPNNVHYTRDDMRTKLDQACDHVRQQMQELPK